MKDLCIAFLGNRLYPRMSSKIIMYGGREGFRHKTSFIKDRLDYLRQRLLTVMNVTACDSEDELWIRQDGRYVKESLKDRLEVT